jgi:hypothetical protein
MILCLGPALVGGMQKQVEACFTHSRDDSRQQPELTAGCWQDSTNKHHCKPCMDVYQGCMCVQDMI